MSNSENSEIASKQKMQLFMAGGMLTFNPAREDKYFRAGDIIKFYPQITIDYYTPSEKSKPYLQHVIYDIYQFRFKPIAKYGNDIHKYCYHYLIEIFSDFKLFCFNWTRRYESFLKLGQWYEGHGQLRNCGNASAYNRNIPPIIMEGIIKTGKISGMCDNLLWRDYGKNRELENNHVQAKQEVYGYDDVLAWHGYSEDLDNFKMNVSKYKDQLIFFNSTEKMSKSANIMFCVELLDKCNAHNENHQL